MNIVLTGPMGSGKTKVGKKLAQTLNINFIDSDSFFSDKTGHTILDYFNEFGEQAFRKKEKELIKDLASKDNHVIATGGGVVLNPINMRNLRRNGLIINLQASVLTIQKRLEHSLDNRPLLQSSSLKEDIKKYSIEREKYYLNADFFIHTETLSIEEVVAEINKIMNLPRVRICACIAGEKPGWQIQQAINQGASLIELRLDLIKSSEIETLIQESGLPIIATDKQHNITLIQAIDAGCDYVDIDDNNPEKERIITYAKRKKCRIIISMHDYDKTPKTIKISNTKGDFLKIATTIHSYEDGQRLLQLLQNQ